MCANTYYLFLQWQVQNLPLNLFSVFRFSNKHPAGRIHLRLRQFYSVGWSRHPASLTGGTEPYEVKGHRSTGVLEGGLFSLKLWVPAPGILLPHPYEVIGG